MYITYVDYIAIHLQYMSFNSIIFAVHWCRNKCPVLEQAFNLVVDRRIFIRKFCQLLVASLASTMSDGYDRTHTIPMFAFAFVLIGLT